LTAPPPTTATTDTGPGPSCGPIPPVAPPPEMGQAGWWRDRTFYEVFVRSFADSNGDGIGDLQGLIGKIDYLQSSTADATGELGVDGLWLMPTFPSPT